MLKHDFKFVYLLVIKHIKSQEYVGESEPPGNSMGEKSLRLPGLHFFLVIQL